MKTELNIWPAPAKINLFLHITGRLDNGYHTLETIFQFLDYGDHLTITPNKSGKITISPDVPGVPTIDNLIYRAAMLLKPYADKTAGAGGKAGADIAIDKILPMGAGLGGGSSNAATTLVALNKLWQCNLDHKKLAALGLTLGADVPIFIGGVAAFAQGVGEILTPVTINQPWYLIIWPGISVSTQDIFNAPELPRDTDPISIKQLDHAILKNDCEKVTKNRHPEVANALEWLIQYAPAKMTGTGSCVFGEFDSEQAAADALLKLPKNMHGFVAKGINKSPLSTKLATTSSD